ncbi:MAG: hypothetical protein UCP83_16285 [Intestinibacter bartlettii]|nr:hypothetical protein [Intestinibacter bartlettii]
MVRRESILNLDYLKIEGNNENYIYYGGDQEWFKTAWRRISGCGPTTASAIIMYENRKNDIEGVKKYSKSKFLDLMNDIWDFITPIKGKGVNTVDLFFEGFKKYTKARYNKYKESIFMKIPINFEDRPNKKEVFNFLYKALEKDHPIAFLNLDNGKENKLHRWHWVAIVGISYDDLSDKLEATIADEGMLKKINLGLWLTTAKNEGGFVYFE